MIENDGRPIIVNLERFDKLGEKRDTVDLAAIDTAVAFAKLDVANGEDLIRKYFDSTGVFRWKEHVSEIDRPELLSAMIDLGYDIFTPCLTGGLCIRTRPNSVWMEWYNDPKAFEKHSR